VNVHDRLFAFDCLKPGGEISEYNSVPGNDALGSWTSWQKLRQGMVGRYSGQFIAPMPMPKVSFRLAKSELRQSLIQIIHVVSEPVVLPYGGRTFLLRLATEADHNRLRAALDKLNKD
jgi:hypothetical protein